MLVDERLSEVKKRYEKVFESLQEVSDPTYAQLLYYRLCRNEYQEMMNLHKVYLLDQDHNRIYGYLPNADD